MIDHYVRCPNGPGATRPHTWKCGKKSGNVCAACGMVRTRAGGWAKPAPPLIRAGHWAQIRNQKPNDRCRCYVESITDGIALLRFGVTTDDGHTRWPFPFEILAPVAVLLPAPRPKWRAA
jgi:hypothetical protein